MPTLSGRGEHREHTAADVNGFGLGSALYKPGMDVAQGKANALAFAQAWREITAPT